MKTKSLKNNKSMRTGVILAVIAIITLIALIVTFAKYASQGTGEDSARVARWGVNSSIPTDLDLFDGSYTSPDGKTVTVDSSDGANVVAPGTSKMQTINLASFTGDQAPEVMYHFEPTLTIVDQSTTSSQTISMLDKLNNNKAFTWKLVDTAGQTLSFQTYQELQNAVAAMGEPDIAPNHFPSNFGGTATPQIKIGWEWAFEYSGTDNDPVDTEIGNLSANGTLTGLNTTLTLNAYQCQGCTTPTNVKLYGNVYSSDGTIVDSVSVTYNYASANGSKSATTDENGYYEMNVPKNSTGIIEFKKDGYESQKQEIGPLTSETEVTIKNFDPNTGPFDLTFVANPSDGGSVDTPIVKSVSAGSEIFDAGNGQVCILDYEQGIKTYVTANAKDGYNFDGWSGLPKSGTVDEDLTITANFTKQTEKIPWALVSSDGTSVTFSYSAEKPSNEGTAYNLIDIFGQYPYPWISENLKTATFDESLKDCDLLPSTKNWFSYMEEGKFCTSLTEVAGLQYLNTSSVTDMSYMFCYCTSLTSLDLSGFDTSNVNDMSYMFFACVNLTALDLTGFNTNDLTKMTSTFQYCQSLTNIDLSSCDLSNVTYFDNTFSGCKKLESIILPETVAKDVSTTEAMFDNCPSLKSLDLSLFDTSNASVIDDMFNGCTQLETVKLNDSFGANATSMTGLFYNCSSLTSINTENINTKNATDFSSMFNGCAALTSLDLSNFNTEKVTDMKQIVANCTSLKSIDISQFNTAQTENMGSMFAGCSLLESVKFPEKDFGMVVTNMENMFQSCVNLKVLDLSSFELNKIQSTLQMFHACSSLTTIYSNNYVSWPATTSESMFAGCTSIVGGAGTVYDGTKDDIEYAHIDSKTNPGYFTSRNLVASAVVATDGSKVTFYYDDQDHSSEGDVYDIALLEPSKNNAPWISSDLITVTFNESFSNYDGLTNLSYWFCGSKSEKTCDNLTTINGLGYLNTSNVTNMYCMFRYCSSITELDLSSFNVEKTTNMMAMFEGCTALTTIYVSEESTWNPEFGDIMFLECTNLIGGTGTTYSSDHVDKEYAHIDSTDNPGYFTAKGSLEEENEATDDALNNNNNDAGILGLLTNLFSGDGQQA